MASAAEMSTAQEPTPTNVGDGINDSNKEKPESPNDSPLGVYAPFPYSSEPFADLSDEAKSALKQIDWIATVTDVAARRLEVEQAWESCHFDRGYQHLLRGKNGGFQIPGAQTGFGAKQQQNSNGIYATNVYGAKGDIIVAALSREIPKQEFFPANPDNGPDIIAAEEAEKFKVIWARNNNLHGLLVDVSRIFWNEDRCMLWTFYELNGQKYGFEESVRMPLVPQNELNPPPPMLTGITDDDEAIDAQTSKMSDPVMDLIDEAFGTETEGGARKPLGMEVTRAFGKLDHKVPISVDKLCDMPWAQIYMDLDVAVVKGMFPWIESKIKPGGDGTSEVELDRIARENVRQAVLGAYVTGDSLQRHTVVKYTWLRPSMFLDEKVNDAVRAELMEAFPDGCLMAKAGGEFAFARNERMDDHLVIGHPIAGKGQNRRSMGAALIAIQKRINDWVDLLDDFFKRTVPKKWMNADAFDMEAMKNQTNIPGSIGPFQPQPGLTTPDQYIMVEPTPQPQGSLPDFIKWFITNLSEEISGALPSLFGAATNTETVGGIAIQRDQALQRIGCPWNYIQDMFAEAARQAVVAAADCRDGKKFTQFIPGTAGESGKNVTVNTANLVRGNVLCFPENNPAFPESWQQRQERLSALVDTSTQNPQVSQWIFSPANLPALADGLRLKMFKVPGASSVSKQKNEFEVLLRSGPQPNPQVLQLQADIQETQEAIDNIAMQGLPVPPDAAAPIQQMQAQIAQLPQYISSVPVAQDESELHSIEADACFNWMTSTEGQKFKNGSPQQQSAYENVHLHWQEHTAMAKKIAAAAANANQKPPSESLSVAVDKMPTNVQIQALQKMGIQAQPTDFAAHQQEQVQSAVQKKAIPEALKGDKPKEKAPMPAVQPKQFKR